VAGCLLARNGEAIEAAERRSDAFRYTPDSECFFSGDDPLAIVAAVPELAALAILPNAPWPALDDRALCTAPSLWKG
jgi:two-component system chemotaxis sensor kinase CheA